MAKIKVFIDSWIIEDENGNSPVDEYYIQDQLNLPHEVELLIDEDEADQVEAVKKKLYQQTGFQPASVTLLD